MALCTYNAQPDLADFLARLPEKLALMLADFEAEPGVGLVCTDNQPVKPALELLGLTTWQGRHLDAAQLARYEHDGLPRLLPIPGGRA
ncbi:MAG: hypothetical protein HC915_18135 [Anaerolineae bacterium]|nr:hypothetical protein [Anaerolineae bacterium]